MTLLPPIAPNFKPLLRRMDKQLKKALVEAQGGEKMKVTVGYLNKAEFQAIAAHFLKRGWQATGYKWVEAYDRHYGGHGEMRVVWVGDAGEKVTPKTVKPRYEDEKNGGDGAPYGGR